MENPYQTSSPIKPPPITGGLSTPSVIALLVRTKPWLQLCAVLGFILGFAILLCGLGVMAGGPPKGNPDNPTIDSMVGWIGGLMFFGGAALYLIGSFRLWQFSSAIGTLSRSGLQIDLEETIDRQRVFWKTAGIMALIAIAVPFAMILIGTVFFAIREAVG